MKPYANLTIRARTYVRRTMSAAAVGAVLPLLVISCAAPTGDERQPNTIVVGAGLAGLSAAVEMGNHGVPVLVMDMNSVAGGHAVLAGGVTMVGTPVQELAGIADTPALAYEDWRGWTEDGDPEWTRLYASESRRMIYDWVTDMGVEFVRVAPGHGNSVPRFHFTSGRAVHLVLPIFRTALRLPTVSFRFNSRVDGLLFENGRVTGVAYTDLRTGQKSEIRADNVVLATGGFENDLDRVLQNWMPGAPLPEKLLSGAAPSANGSGHDMAVAAGAGLTRMDRHYIYVNGLPDPRDPAGRHALTAGNELSLWVNADGRRFTNETGFDKDILVDLLRQKGNTYWAVFDGMGRQGFSVRGAAWLNNPGDRHPVLDDPRLAVTANSLVELADAAGLPRDSLVSSVQRFNAMIERGTDDDFHRFSDRAGAPGPVSVPPYYAVRLFPMTRKSMGGVAIDRGARVLDRNGEPVAGLYAAGELTGSVGINGQHGLDGMFLGPAILTGRLAGRSVSADYASAHPAAAMELLAVDTETAGTGAAGPDLSEDTLRQLLSANRDGYWHFRVSHELVIERGYECDSCHSSQVPFAPPEGRAGYLAQSTICTNCH